MRKFLWSGTISVLLIGTGMFLGAQHAAYYPHSFVGRCARTVYHMWEPMVAFESDQVAELKVNALPPALPPQVAQVSDRQVDAVPVVLRDVIEPILVEPTDQEPPLALPRLSPEVAAAIERLRGEEESEAPPKAFDGPSKAPHMPYADEDLELLPVPKSQSDAGDGEGDRSGGIGLLFLPPSCWQTMLEKVMEVVYPYAEPTPRLDEPADLNKPGLRIPDDQSSEAIHQSSHVNYHENACPYLGSYMIPYRFIDAALQSK